ncbi:MAG: GNAT family N-acetyltransferase [Defluviitaleaceae bacterium]|nr:GNAT family N-acetyltransferase [Defluviitaleaceae bacterium]
MISEKIIENELVWLQSIGCTIDKTTFGFSAEHFSNKSTDFNFIHYSNCKESNKENCVRISSKDEKLHVIEASLLSNRYLFEPMFDINFITKSNKTNEIQEQYFLKEIDLDKWCERFSETRAWNKIIKYYIICNEEYEIGKICIATSDDLSGYYDFEIFKEYRHQAHGTESLKRVMSLHENSNYHFIQTWSGNINAIKCYLKCGFHIFENLYRYTLKSQ